MEFNSEFSLSIICFNVSFGFLSNSSLNSSAKDIAEIPLSKIFLGMSFRYSILGERYPHISLSCFSFFPLTLSGISTLFPISRLLGRDFQQAAPGFSTQMRNIRCLGRNSQPKQDATRLPVTP